MQKKKTGEVIEATVALLTALVLAVVSDKKTKGEKEKNS
jgi:hypothetical protein